MIRGIISPMNGATVRAISARCRFMASVSAKGRTRPAAVARPGQTAPKMQAHGYRVSRIAPGRAAAPGPDAGQGALPADPCFVLEPDRQRLVPCPRGDRPSYRFGAVFLNATCACGSDFGCCGRDLQPPKARCRQLLADAALVQGDAEHRRDAVLRILAPPVYHAVARGVGADLDPGRKLGQLLLG